ARGVIMKASATGAELEIDTLAIATTRVAINRKAKATFETQSDLFSTVETAAILPIRAETQMFAKRTRAGGMIKPAVPKNRRKNMEKPVISNSRPTGISVEISIFV